MLLAVIQKSKGTLRQQSQSALLTYLFLQQFIQPWKPYALDSSHSMKNKVLNGLCSSELNNCSLQEEGKGTKP